MGSVAAFRVTQINASAPTDSELIARTLGGDGGAFALLVDRFQRKIYRVAYAIVRNDVEADTIAQDTFIQAYTHLRRRRFVSLFTGDQDDETREGWIEPVDERPDPEREIMAHQLRIAIERAERKLSTQQKVIFRLRHYEDRSLKEIANLLGLRSGTVRAHLFRAIHKIRKELAEWVTAREEPSDETL